MPGLLADHYAWIPVEQDPAYQRNITFTFNHPTKDFTKSVTLMTYGAARLVPQPAGPGSPRVTLLHSGTPIKWPYTDSIRKPISVLHEGFDLEVIVHPDSYWMQVLWFETYFVTHFVAGSGPIVVHVTPKTPGAPLPEVSVASQPVTSNLSLCRSLQHGN